MKEIELNFEAGKCHSKMFHLFPLFCFIAKTTMHCLHPCRCQVSYSYSLVRLYPWLGFSINILQYKYIAIDSASHLGNYNTLTNNKCDEIMFHALVLISHFLGKRRSARGRGGSPLADKICQTVFDRLPVNWVTLFCGRTDYHLK